MSEPQSGVYAFGMVECMSGHIIERKGSAHFILIKEKTQTQTYNLNDYCNNNRFPYEPSTFLHEKYV